MAAVRTSRAGESRGTLARRAAGVVGAAAAALLIWIVAVPVAGLDLRADQGGRVVDIGVVPVLLVSLGAGLAGWALLAVLERFGPRGRQIWAGVAVVVLLLSLLGPLTGGVGAGTRVALSLMHVAVAAVLLAAFLGGGRSPSSGRVS